MQIETTRFGQIEINSDRIISFPEGILGFPEYRDYALVQTNEEGHFFWLQSIERPELAFVVCDPLLFVPDYQVPVKDEDLELLEIKSMDDDNTGDTLRLVWWDEPNMGHLNKPKAIASQVAQNDLGYVPGYGEVRRRHLFDDDELYALSNGYCGFVDLGNAAATWIDTLGNGSSTYKSTTLQVDLGRGTREFVANFIVVNPRQDITADAFCFTDSAAGGGSYAQADYDSTFQLHAPWDSTEVMDNVTYRGLVIRTDPIYLSDNTTYHTFEYAVGRARLVDDQLPPVYPEVMWTDGSVQRPPNRYRKR